MVGGIVQSVLMFCYQLNNFHYIQIPTKNQQTYASIYIFFHGPFCDFYP